MYAILRQDNNHSINNYVESCQEQFLIVALGSESNARKYMVDDAYALAERLSRINHGHVTYSVEII